MKTFVSHLEGEEEHDTNVGHSFTYFTIMSCMKRKTRSINRTRCIKHTRKTITLKASKNLKYKQHKPSIKNIQKEKKEINLKENRMKKNLYKSAA